MHYVSQSLNHSFALARLFVIVRLVLASEGRHTETYVIVRRYRHTAFTTFLRIPACFHAGNLSFLHGSLGFWPGYWRGPYVFRGVAYRGDIYENQTCYTYTCELRDEGDVKSFEMLR